MDLHAMELNPTDELAKNSLLNTLRNSNFIIKFFVSRGFNRYYLKWSPWMIFWIIIAWQGVLLWGSFALIYILITWMGTAIFYTVIRKHPKYSLLLGKRHIQMSNVFLIYLVLGAVLIKACLWAKCDSGIIFGLVCFLLFSLLTSISFFEIKSRKGKILFSAYIVISLVILILNLDSFPFLGFLSLLLLLIYAFFFSFDIAFK